MPNQLRKTVILVAVVDINVSATSSSCHNGRPIAVLVKLLVVFV